MEKAKYSGRYNGKDPSKLDGAPDPNWYSEYLAHMPNYKDLTAPPLYNEFPTNLEERKHLWDNQISFDIELNAISKFEDPRKNTMSSWTCHTSVYNIQGADDADCYR